ncbi:MAG TPA: hypothetical protein VLH35_09015 [Candidatus Acidoferrales bacterium]|nr:hypothetical protein [Candidatus Acidoferrales bacterium]
MTKPYRVTGESRYLGLPLGFGFLGLSHLFSAYTFFAPPAYRDEVVWFQLSARSFAFAFLALTYYFSKKPSKNSRLWWNITLSVLVVALLMCFILAGISSQLASTAYRAGEIYARLFNVICLTYISIHIVRVYLKKHEPRKGRIALGFIQFAISQALLIIWAAYVNYTAFWVAMALLLSGLCFIVVVSYQAFYRPKKEQGYE